MGHRTRFVFGVFALTVVLAAPADAQKPKPSVAPPPPIPPAAAPPPRAPAPPPAAEPSSGEAEKVLLANPMFEILREVDPEGFEIVRRMLQDAVANKLPPGVLMAQAQEMFQARLPRYVLAGTDEGVVEYYKSFATRLEVLGRVSAAECHGLATGLTVASATVPMSPEVVDSAMATMVSLMMLLESNKGRSPVTFSEAQVAVKKEAMFHIMVAVTLAQRDYDILSADSVEPKDYARSCELNTEIFKRILREPAAEAAGLLRFLAAEGQ